MAFQLPPGFNQSIREARAYADKVRNSGASRTGVGDVAPEEAEQPPALPESPLDALFPGGQLPGLWQQPNNQQATPWQSVNQLKAWANTLDPLDPATQTVYQQINQLEQAIGPSPQVRMMQQLLSMLFGTLFGGMNLR